jgi:hypothetical protein
MLFRRDPARDRQQDSICFEGYEVLWPDGRAVNVGMDILCTHGQRLLGLGRHLAGCRERLLNLLCFPQPGRDTNIVRLPGHRVRRFYLERQGRQGRWYFLDGTPTVMVFDLDRDERPLMDWMGLSGLADGEGVWFDLAVESAAPLDVPTPTPVLLPRETAV